MLSRYYRQSFVEFCKQARHFENRKNKIYTIDLAHFCSLSRMSTSDTENTVSFSTSVTRMQNQPWLEHTSLHQQPPQKMHSRGIAGIMCWDAGKFGRFRFGTKPGKVSLLPPCHKKKIMTEHPVIMLNPAGLPTPLQHMPGSKMGLPHLPESKWGHCTLGNQANISLDSPQLAMFFKPLSSALCSI